MTQLSQADIAKLKAVLPVIEKLLAEADLPQGGALSRGPDGRHLDAKGVEDLHAAFEGGMNPYQASKHFGLAYRAASLRYTAWKASKKTHA
jgi:hypothetical protein